MAYSEDPGTQVGADLHRVSADYAVLDRADLHSAEVEREQS